VTYDIFRTGPVISISGIIIIIISNYYYYYYY